MIKPSEMTEQEILVKVGAKIKSCHEHKRELQYELTFAQTLKIFRSTEVCFYTGQPFTDWNDITFERINPLLGYVKGNVVLVKNSVNSFKGSTLDKFFYGNPIEIERSGELLIQLGKHLLQRAKKRKEAKEKSDAIKQARIASLSEQTQIMKGGKAND